MKNSPMRLKDVAKQMDGQWVPDAEDHGSPISERQRSHAPVGVPGGQSCAHKTRALDHPALVGPPFPVSSVFVQYAWSGRGLAMFFYRPHETARRLASCGGKNKGREEPLWIHSGRRLESQESCYLVTRLVGVSRSGTGTVCHLPRRYLRVGKLGNRTIGESGKRRDKRGDERRSSLS